MTKEQLSEIEPLTNGGLEKLVAELAVSNEPKFNMTKLAEECSELAEVCLKWVNKQGERKPSAEAIADEIADVMLRSMIVDDMLETNQYVTERLFKKAAKLRQWADEGKYKGGI